jgi:ubiquinone/menaquinone biosynthesis C-methylase UbiE
MKNEFEIQNDYYKNTALEYDAMHVNEDIDKEHQFALFFLSAMIEQYKISSILDIGAGTGRVILELQRKYPQIKIMGIEPVKELREVGYKKGISKNVLIDGNGV